MVQDIVFVVHKSKFDMFIASDRSLRKFTARLSSPNLLLSENIVLGSLLVKLA